jgi:hypothetical protein
MGTVVVMRLAIADPPYLGTAEMLYGARQLAAMNVGGSLGRHTTDRDGPMHKADAHPDAVSWDDPVTHRAMVDDLVAGFDGWGIALRPGELFHYLRWVPDDTRIAVWHDPQTMPTGSHPRRRWEAVLVYRPPGRRRITDVPTPVGDVLTCPHTATGFAGAKPLAWVEWVLAMMGYCPTHDTVDDLFHGSGAIAAALAQGRLIECKCAVI